MKKKNVLMSFGIVVLLIFLIGCAPKELSEQEMQELDKQLENLSDEELQEIAAGSEEGKALAGQAIGKVSIKTKVPPADVAARAKEILEKKKPVCGDGKCDPVETEIDCPQDCKFELKGCGNGKCEKGENLLNCNTDCSKCYDTDYGKNLEKFGGLYVELDKLHYFTDICNIFYPEKIFEYYCENGEAKSKQFNCPNGKICNQGECVAPIEVFVCGNGICENEREKASKCEADCGWGSCKGNKNQCNEKVDVFCACGKEEHLIQKEGIPCQGTFSCDNCDKQEALLDDYAAMQSQVYDCLTEYFQFKPPRVSYPVVYNSEVDLCNNKNGCVMNTPGKPIPGLGIFLSNFQGNWSFGENQPTKPEQLIADKHEPTHYFMRYMLHSYPGWFDEAIAIQTEERLKCTAQDDPAGDAHLQETDYDFQHLGGISMSDKSVLNEDYYKKLKNNKTKLSGSDFDDHVIGALWIIGLKLDYNCEKDCIRDIVLKVSEAKKITDEQCKVSPNKCGFSRRIIFNTGKATCSKGFESPTGNVVLDKIPPSLPPQEKQQALYWALWWGSSEEISPAIIKQATDEVLTEKYGKPVDTADLFQLLEVNY